MEKEMWENDAAAAASCNSIPEKPAQLNYRQVKIDWGGGKDIAYLDKDTNIV